MAIKLKYQKWQSSFYCRLIKLLLPFMAIKIELPRVSIIYGCRFWQLFLRCHFQQSTGLPNHKCSFWVLNPKVKKFFEISWFYWIHLIILEKMRSCLWKLQLGFWTYGLISPLPKYLGPNCPKLVFWP